MISFNPGQSPPQVTIAADVFPGIEVNLLTGASHLEIERTEPSLEHVPHSLHRIVVDDSMLFRSKPVYSSMPVPQGR